MLYYEKFFLGHFSHGHVSLTVQDKIKIVIRLEGRAKVAFTDGEKLDGFFKEGVLHGFARWEKKDGS